MANNHGRNKPKRAPSTPAQPTSETTLPQAEPSPKLPLAGRGRLSLPAKSAAVVAGSVVVAALGIAGNALGIWGKFWPAAPEVHVQDYETNKPFRVRFSIKNPSVLFDMHRVEFSCHLDNVRYVDDHGGAQSIVTVSTDKVSTIEASQEVLYRCTYDNFIQLPWDIESAQIAIVVEYQTMHSKRKSATHFSWEKESRRWIPGRLVN